MKKKLNKFFLELLSFLLKIKKHTFAFISNNFIMVKKKLISFISRVLQTVKKCLLELIQFLLFKLNTFCDYLKNRIYFYYYCICSSVLEFIKFVLYRNNKLSKVKIIGILLMSIILTLVYNLYVWLGLDITLSDIFTLYFSILLVFQAIICELPLFVIKTVYKELLEVALYIENGGPAFQASLLGLLFKLISIFFFEGKPTPYQFFSERIREFLKKKD